jgi:hypothetical protein
MLRSFSNGRHALRDAELAAGEADPAFPEHAAHGQARPAHHRPVTRDQSGRGDDIMALVSSVEPAVSPYGHDVNITTPE